ncbi:MULTISPECIES: hemerythrin family protein [unclassified Leptolyngbya]|uniref:bacteriohemerythrin n=1 Tax=unclassified Leptolyngbya TaxID=2650499 RepID=UPI00168234D3|nr:MULTISPECIES: hemerythrin family protein [unclassified Leptolyngbya]MBD1912326.1 hemerythrin family protein [Leptolyngbya sp. FACHB-8]MBD2158038.1 hemerythrin family protein [Leptolyngbya sp. FACHB-16]
MQRFAWNDSLSTGVPMIDAHHKELIAAVNDLAQAIEQGQGSNAIKKLIMFLKYYAEWHFDHEEKCAAKHQCPMADTNEKAHAAFIETFGNLHEQYRQSNASEAVAQQIYDELSRWLVGHIMNIDTEIGRCLRQPKTVLPTS